MIRKRTITAAIAAAVAIAPAPAVAHSIFSGSNGTARSIAKSIARHECGRGLPICSGVATPVFIRTQPAANSVFYTVRIYEVPGGSRRVCVQTFHDPGSTHISGFVRSLSAC